jgi:hypothetical protein
MVVDSSVPIESKSIQAGQLPVVTAILILKTKEDKVLLFT